MTGIKLAGFTGDGYDKGRGPVWQALWVITSAVMVERIWCSSRLRVLLLRLFGAHIGKRVLVRHHVRVHWPWKLSVADDVLIGVDAWLLNLEPITIGSNVCISQGVFLCTGSHRFDSPTFEFDNGPIVVEDGVWIASRATVLRGVTVGRGSLIGAMALVSGSVPEGARVLAPRPTVIPPGGTPT